MALHWAGTGTAVYDIHGPETLYGAFLAQSQTAPQYEGCCLGGVRFQGLLIHRDSGLRAPQTVII